MSDPRLEKLLRALHDTTGYEPKQTGDRKWITRCPAHDDNNPSLSIGYVGSTFLNLRCFAGCTRVDVLAAIGMTNEDLNPKRGKPGKTILATYDYRDEAGELVFQVVRFSPKTFQQRRPDGKGGFHWNVKGCKVVPYRLPELLSADTSSPVFVVEGEKDANELASLGLVATCNSGGAGKWKPKHAAHLANRRVVILPDNDEAGCRHAEQVAQSLAGKAKSIKVVSLPGLPDKGDVSDWLTSGGTREALFALVENTPEIDQATIAAGSAKADEQGGSGKDQGKKEKPGLIKSLADLICETDHFAQDAGKRLYHYLGGTYRIGGEEFIRQRVKHLCILLKQTEEWSPRLANDVCEFIRVDAPPLWDRPPSNVINVDNGLLHLVRGEALLVPHNHEHLTTVQLPIIFDPQATCPNIDQFVSEVFPDDAVQLAYEIPALLMTPNTSIQKAILLLGAGGNGKSTYLNMVMSFLGKQNTSSVALHRLESDRFSVARLCGKLANICADLPTEHLASTSIFKALTGGDALEAEYKFRDSFQFEPFARLVFSANSPPRSQDASEGFFDRWLVVPFEARFRGTKREVSRQELDSRLSQPAELSGLLNKAIAAWQQIQQSGRLTEPESVQAAWREFHATTDPMAVWLDRFTIEDPQAAVPKSVLRSAYGANCERNGRPTLSEKKFTQLLAKHRPLVESAQRMINSQRPWCYVGIGLKNEPFDPAHDAQDAQDDPYLIQSHANETNGQNGNGCSEKQDRGEPVHPVHPVNGHNPEFDVTKWGEL